MLTSKRSFHLRTTIVYNIFNNFLNTPKHFNCTQKVPTIFSCCFNNKLNQNMKFTDNQQHHLYYTKDMLMFANS